MRTPFCFAALFALLAPALVGQTAFTVRNTKAGGNFLWSIASGPAGLVAVGDGGTILTSTNGSTWTRRNSGVTDWLVGVAYGSGQYIAVGDNGRILSSSDGIGWLNVPQSATTARLNNVLYAAGKFVAVGEAGTIITSPDGRGWTARVSGVTGWLHGLTFRTSIFYTTGQGGKILLSGSAGDSWSLVAPTANGFYTGTIGLNDLESVASIDADDFIAVGQDGTLVYLITTVNTRPAGPNGFPAPFSVFLRNITSGTVGVSARFRCIAQGANALFATGENGVIVSAPSLGGPWAQLVSGTTANLVGGLYVGNSLFVVGENETILESTPLYNSRLANISTRGQVGTGGNIMISGLVVTGAAKKSLLVRAAGPALAAFGVTGTLVAPVLTVFDGAGRPVATNTGWATAANAAAIATTGSQVGAFAFSTGSADSALLLSIDPGSYTLQVSGLNSGTGVALVEAYDADGPASDASRAINISTRGLVGTGGDALIAGFNISGAASRRVLIRAVGPTLGAFGVTGTLAEPVFEVYSGSTVTASARGSWSQQTNADEIRGAAVLAGAFALTEDSKDAALIVTLAPGSWTVMVSGVDNTTGVALVEVYDLP